MKKRHQIKNIIVTAYYALIVFMLTGQAISTVYQLSMNAGYNDKVSILQQQKDEISQEKSKLAQQISKAQSISLVGNEQMPEDFQLITQPIIISANNNLALR